mmetsp:Transcript_5015/g.20046  ORF Transcript_5015/g.20046 Transcript_5015/m.20046 type:complete len:323 (-) Transcript_5015:518-1486(-)
MVEVHMGVTNAMDKVSRLQARDLRDDARQQRVGSDVERHAEAHVTGPLVQQAGQLTICHVELGHHVTRRQRHLRKVARVPRGQDVPPGFGIGLQVTNDLPELVDALSSVVGVHVAILSPKVPPLEAVDRPQVPNFAIREAPLVQELSRTVAIPNVDVLLRKNVRVGASLDEPEKLLGQPSPEDPLGRQQRKASVAERKAHLHAELAERASSGPISALHPAFDDVTHKVKVLPLCVVRIGPSLRLRLGLGLRRAIRGGRASGSTLVGHKAIPEILVHLVSRFGNPHVGRAVDAWEKSVAAEVLLGSLQGSHFREHDPLAVAGP